MKKKLQSPNSESARRSHSAQITWSVCVAVVVAIVALQQAMGSRHVQNTPAPLPIQDFANHSQP